MKTNSQQNTLKSGLSSDTRRIILVFFHRHLELGEQEKNNNKKAKNRITIGKFKKHKIKSVKKKKKEFVHH